MLTFTIVRPDISATVDQLIADAEAGFRPEISDLEVLEAMRERLVSEGRQAEFVRYNQNVRSNEVLRTTYDLESLAVSAGLNLDVR